MPAAYIAINTGMANKMAVPVLPSVLSSQFKSCTLYEFELG
jgi:hypothetical protein